MMVGVLVVNITGLCLFWTTSSVGIILAIVALATAASNPSHARTCGFIAWGMFGLSTIRLVLHFMFYWSWWFLA